MRGFVVTDPDMGPKHGAEHGRDMARWIADGSFKARLSLTHGIEDAAEGFVGMLEGRNFGKAVLVVAEI